MFGAAINVALLFFIKRTFYHILYMTPRFFTSAACDARSRDAFSVGVTYDTALLFLVPHRKLRL